MTSTTPEHDVPGSPRNSPFIDAVIRGDDDYVRAALAAGEDVNSTDTAGRSAVACAITGESWETADASDASFMTTGRLNTMRMLVEHQHVSLYALNAPQDAMNGATPLGMAAWLNAPQMVQILLEHSAGAVSVDGTDIHKATALMYAARDGSGEVADCLLSNGARPDYRDRNHRSPIQYALGHTMLLYSCECALRTQRTREVQSGNKRRLCPAAQGEIDRLIGDEDSRPRLGIPALAPPGDSLTMTSSVIKAIVTPDLAALRSILFSQPETPQISETSPVLPRPLVNRPDAQAWSPVHYCTSLRSPSIEVLDTLYRAGADVSLFSKIGNFTPLHCLVHRKRGPDRLRDREANATLYQFVVHLVCDLRAPLDAQDSERETCMHVAAEHGDSAEILRAMLDCDTDRSVMEMRNSRGLTPLDVAKPEFRSVFGIHDESRRPPSSASLLTIRPLHHSSSVPSLNAKSSSSWLNPQRNTALAPLSVKASYASPLFEHILRNLRTVAHELSVPLDPTLPQAIFDHWEELLRDAETRNQSALRQLSARIDDTRDDLVSARATWTDMDALLDSTAQTVEDIFLKQAAEREKEESPTEPVGRNRSGTTVSADSERTAVSLASSADAPLDGEEDQVGPLSPRADDTLLPPWPSWLDTEREGLLEAHSTISPGDEPSRVYGRLKSYKSMSDLHRRSPTGDEPPKSPTRTRRARADTLIDSSQKPEAYRPGSSKSSVKEMEKGNTSRIKAWFKKLLPERPLKSPSTSPPPTFPSSESEPRWSLNTLCEQNEPLEKGGKEAQADFVQQNHKHLAYRALAATGKDLARIDECMTDADKLIAAGYRAIARTDRVMGRALQTRRALLQEHRSARKLDASLQTVYNQQNSDLTPDNPPKLLLDIPKVCQSHNASVSSTSSPVSAMSRLPPSRENADDRDTQILEYLMMIKLDDSLDTASDEVEKVDLWLSIVRTVLKGVQKRAGVQL